MADQDRELEKIGRRLQSVEQRLSKLESSVTIPGNESPFRTELQVSAVDPLLITDTLNEEEQGIESQIGRFGLAWLGNIVLLFGITFMTQYLIILGHRYFSVIFGYTAAAAIFFLANYLKKTNEHLAFMFKLNAQILLFYITMRLHFFTSSPIIIDKRIALILLVLVVILQSYFSIRNKSQGFAALSVFLALSTAILADVTHFTLPLVTLTASGAIYCYFRFNWQPLFLVTLFLTYITFFLWLFGNPFMGHPLQLISEQQSGIIYLFFLGAGYSILLLFRKSDATSDDFLIGVTMSNGILFSFLLLILVLRFFTADYVTLFGIITVCCLLYSTFLHSKSDWNFASAFYALYGFMAMSISLYGLYGFPRVYLLLSVQSLIVVSMALWFRNRLIVVMNSLFFLTIIIIYILSSKTISGVNFSFVMISLISARIINWKRSRLQIETDLLRNLYMIDSGTITHATKR